MPRQAVAVLKRKGMGMRAGVLGGAARGGRAAARRQAVGPKVKGWGCAQACVVAPREAGGLPRGARLCARALMYLALLAGSGLAAARVLPSPMYLASALADPSLPQVPPLAPCIRVVVNRVCLAAARVLPLPMYLALALANPSLPQVLLRSELYGGMWGLPGPVCKRFPGCPRYAPRLPSGQGPGSSCTTVSPCAGPKHGTPARRHASCGTCARLRWAEPWAA